MQLLILRSYVSLSDNEKTGFRARELKSVHLDAVGTYLRITFHRNHANRHNRYNQVNETMRKMSQSVFLSLLSEGSARSWDFGISMTSTEADDG